MSTQIGPKSAVLIQCPPAPSDAFSISLQSSTPIDVFYLDEENAKSLKETGDFKNQSNIIYKILKTTSLNDTIMGMHKSSYFALVNLSESEAATCNFSISRIQLPSRSTSISAYGTTGGYSGVSGYGIITTEGE